jgi:peptidoglycan/LPS O-acetylase OafA/YrhL
MTKPLPKFLQLALTCIWLSLAVLMLSALLPLFFIKPDAEFQKEIVLLVGSITAFVIGAYLAVKIASRRNWARWIFSIICVLGVVALCGFVLIDGLDSFGWSLIDVVLAVIQYGLSISAIVLLFLPESNKWFEKIGADGEL